MSIVVRSNQPMASAPLGAPFAPGRALYRAVFGAGDTSNLVGTQTGEVAGGSIGTWQGTPNGLAVSGGSVVRGSATGTSFIGLPILGAGANMSWIFRTLPTASAVYLDLFRDINGGGAPDSYRLEVMGTTARLMKREGGALSYLGSSFSVAAGQRLGIRWVGGLLVATVNDAVVSQVLISTIPAVGYAGIALAAGTLGFAIDNMEIDVY